MMKKRVVLMIMLGIGAVAQAADIAAGRAKSGTCVACHGPDGISHNPAWPNLAGQKDQYLIRQLRAFRDGDREDPIMGPMAQGLSDADIEDLAAYYSNLPPGGK